MGIGLLPVNNISVSLCVAIIFKIQKVRGGSSVVMDEVPTVDEAGDERFVCGLTNAFKYLEFTE